MLGTKLRVPVGPSRSLREELMTGLKAMNLSVKEVGASICSPWVSTEAGSTIAEEQGIISSMQGRPGKLRPRNI